MCRIINQLTATTNHPKPVKPEMWVQGAALFVPCADTEIALTCWPHSWCQGRWAGRGGLGTGLSPCRGAPQQHGGGDGGGGGRALAQCFAILTRRIGRKKQVIVLGDPPSPRAGILRGPAEILGAITAAFKPT